MRRLGIVYRMRFDAIAVTPFTSAEHVRLSQQGFTESGAGARDLAVSRNRFSSRQPETGLRVAHLPMSLDLYVGIDAPIASNQNNETLGLELRGQF